MLSRFFNHTAHAYQDNKIKLVTEWDQMKKRFLKELDVKRCEQAMRFLAKKGFYPRDWINFEALDEARFQKADCEICMDALTSRPIFSCKRCHNLMCVKCYRAVQSCPFCRARGLDFGQRNIAVERFISTLLLPCKFHRYGCTVLLNREIRVQHEKRCKHEPIYCPFFNNCGYNGNFSEVELHLERLHDTTLILKNQLVWGITGLRAMMVDSVGGKVKHRVMLCCYESLFTVQISFLNEKLYFTFKKIRNTQNKSDEKQYGVFVELRSPVQTIKGMVHLSKEINKQKLELLPYTIVPQSGFDNMQVFLNIKLLDDLLK